MRKTREHRLDHIQEVLEKWHQIEDEIWAKVILFERNRRIAKAYARAPVLTINGSDDGFDGFRIGLNGFDNPMRDKDTLNCKRLIDHGVKIKMDDQGNILIKRVSNKCKIFIKNTSPNGTDETSIGSDVLKSGGNNSLEPDKPYKLFDMTKFQQNVTRELQRAYPDRRRLECQCLSTIVFVKNEKEILNCPVWVMIINVVALDMLKSKLPPVQRAVDIRNRPRIPIPDEDPYSVAGNGSGSSGSNTSGPMMSSNGPPAGYVAATREQLLLQQARRSDKPPKLPPRDNVAYPHDIPKPDYDDIEEENNSKLPSKLFRPFQSSRGKDKSKDSKKHDDPYYCGLSARVPNFVKLSANRTKPLPKETRESVRGYPMPSYGVPPHPPPPHPHPGPHYMSYQQPPLWHTRSYESGMDSDHLESPYNHIYGRLPVPTRSYIPQAPRTMFVGEWD
ncbi:conserved hypothetical protein [Pediculus humanus corporis]|uniref:MH2 domain-containing protein n=1 Tax=Pediculus humanus subsp. corporis TaxID=121224 RepID=E0VUT4_PEDHC|nr:uncharacterized protein Phum_PHUM454780 [Pediculus humanus corporis]EEB17140.1 conserved hypothetical protein [Pediculus humanus corporis]